MSLVWDLKKVTAAAIENLFTYCFEPEQIQVAETKPEFEGDYTIVLFALAKPLRQSPEKLGNTLGGHLIKTSGNLFKSFTVVKGFLNLTIQEAYVHRLLKKSLSQNPSALSPKKIIVEYSSPNTNKPLHLGHLRNNFLGWSVAEILKAAGHEVFKTCVVNDRGVHICKSMIAWQRFAGGATPQSTGTKGDHLVGDYYVQFNNAYKKEVDALMAEGKTKEEAEKGAPIMLATQQMLQDWERGDAQVMDLWREMNGWVYKGFDETYQRIGSDFEKVYYESNTYLLGKKVVEEGLEKNILYKKEDGSVWIDLTDEGLDQKLLLRRDGTSVYITQDLGLAQQKFDDFPHDQSIYVIGDEQNYHMDVLKAILKKLGKPYAAGIFHLSYGMVELPSGRMKSREGTVVDADDLLDEMAREAAAKTAEHSDVASFTQEELSALYEMIGTGALKFFLLRVDPKKKMIFNPEESIDFHGYTGPFIQYTHARIKSILRKAGAWAFEKVDDESLLPLEKKIILLLEKYSDVIETAAKEYAPSQIAAYAFETAKTFNAFYAEHSVMRAESETKKALRLQICQQTADVLKNTMQLLGIGVPERM